MSDEGGAALNESTRDSVPAARESLTRAQRAAAMSAGRAPVPTKFIVWTVATLVTLGLGGVLVEHFFGNVGLPTTRPANFTTTTAIPGGALESGLDAFMGLKQIGSAQATPFALRDQSGSNWSLRDARGRVVVLGFYDAACGDICPVLGAEIKQARSILGTTASRVEFVIVNTNPRALSTSTPPPALSRPGLAGLADVHFLSGSLRQLDAVWSAYGVQVRVGAAPSQVVHNDVMFFISPRGRLVAQVTPFANEDRGGHFHLAAAEVSRFARGIAQTAASLVR